MVRAVTPIPFVKARFFDRCGKPLAGGKVYTYEANTTTPKVTYKDPYGLTPNTNPIILDAAGEADIYLDGTYRIRITDRNDVLVNDVEKIGSWFSDNLQDTLDNISGAMDEALKPVLQNLEDAINAAAAAGAGANGWTTDLVVENGLTQKQINAVQKIANSDLYNVPEKYGADVNAIDNTAALQKWLDSSKVVHLPAGKTYKFNGTLNINQTDINIIGLSQSTYGKSVLQYTGNGTAIKFTGSAGYPCFKNWTLTGTVTTENAVFELGTLGVDIWLGGSIDAQNWFINAFETLLKSNANSYYNRFFNCRFSNFRVGLDSFASNNLNILLCRVYCFTDFLKTLGGAGPINIKYNSFEQFNGVLHRSNNDKCELNFDSNYVEIYDKVALPANFTVASQQSKGAYFGGNILFFGYYSSFKNTNNKLSIAGVFRLGSFSACDYLESRGNTISLYETNNNLSYLYVTNAPIGYVYINDRRFGSLGAAGGYSVTYNRSSFPGLMSVRNRYYYYDCILDANQVLLQKVYNVPPLLNGWTIATANGGSTLKVIAQDDGSTQIIGSVSGTSKTANEIFTIPESHRPAEYNTTQAYILLSTTTTTGTINTVLMRYFYTTGSFELLTDAANLGNVLINLNIPPRI